MADDQQQPPDQPPDDATKPDDAKPDDATRQLPAPDAPGDETAVLPAAAPWSGRAGVPPPDLAGVRAATPTEVWQEPVPTSGRRWWLPVLIAAFALALFALVGYGLWLAFRDDGTDANPGVPVLTASATATASDRTARATATEGPTRTQNRPEQVVVPRLAGMDQQTAQAVLDQLGLAYRLTFRPSSTAPPGTVLETQPGEGSVVSKGSEVTIVLATAPRTTAPAAPSPTGSVSPTATPTD